jgi:hypothetical protein
MELDKIALGFVPPGSEPGAEGGDMGRTFGRGRESERGGSESAALGDDFETPGRGESVEVLDEHGEMGLGGGSFPEGEGEFGEDAGDAGDGAVAEFMSDGFGEDAVVADDADGVELGRAGEGFEDVETAAAVLDADDVFGIADQIEGEGQVDRRGAGGEVVDEGGQMEAGGDAAVELGEVDLLVGEEVGRGNEKRIGADGFGVVAELQDFERGGGAGGGDEEFGGAEGEAGAGGGFAAFLGGGEGVFAGGAVDAESGDVEGAGVLEEAIEGVPEGDAGFIAGEEYGGNNAADGEMGHLRIVVSIRV